MKLFIAFSVFAYLQSFLTAASPLQMRSNKPAAFFLAGDSTTAAQSCCGGGWGNGFLTTLRTQAIGTNFGHNGATTVSFVSGADWADVLESVNRYKKIYSPYVTIQFGHNDQKATSNITLDQYSRNLEDLALDVQKAGGYPIFVTPLSRRNYNSSNVIIEDLAAQANTTISVAKSLNVFVIDLNRHSTDYLNRIGKSNATQYNLIPTDSTHLNRAGTLLFGNMVSGLILEAVRSVHGYLSPNRTIWDAVQAGRFILPS